FCSFLCLFNAFCFRVTFNQYFIYLLRLNGRSETQCAVYHTDWTPHSRSKIFSSTLGAVLSAPQNYCLKLHCSFFVFLFFVFFFFGLFVCFFVFFFITGSFSFSTTTLHLDFLNGCLPLCTEDQFRLHFQLLLLPVGLSILLHFTHHTPETVKCIYFCGSHFLIE
uniref:Uncharacterized protein n=1 Tax=Macaca fascicularis TaxID=9541 RepID=A0A7N9IEK9_MACFA